MSVHKSRAWVAVLCGGMIAAVLDLTFAFVFNGIRGVTPLRVMQSVASGLLGADAFEGGTGAAALGVLAHFLILIVAAAIFYAASRRLSFLTQRPVVSGLLYGVAIYVFMNFIVLPLSAIPFKPPHALVVQIPHVIGHMFLVGLPISLAVGYASLGRKRLPAPAL